MLRKAVDSINVSLDGNRYDATRRVIETIVEAFRPRKTTAHNLLAGHLTRSVLAANMQDFQRKSSRKSDRWGRYWLPLKPSTINRKRRDPNSIRINPRAYKRYKQALERSQRKIAALGRHSPRQTLIMARRAAQIVLGAHNIQINVDTGRLRNSLRPGAAATSGYYAVPDQVFVDTGQSWIFGTQVPYSVHVQKARPILPRDEQAADLIQAGLASALGPTLRFAFGQAGRPASEA